MRLHADVVALARDLDARRAHLHGERLEIAELGALDEDVAALDHRGGDHVRAGLDAVGDDRVIERRELAAVGADDVDDVGAGAVHLGAHLVEDAAELLDLGLARAVDERGAALRERRGHHQVLGAGHRRQVEDDLGAAQAPPPPGPSAMT